MDTILDDAGGFRTAENQVLSYRELVDGNGAVIDFDEDKGLPVLYTFDSSRQKRQVGKSAQPLGMQALVTGVPVFAGDVPIDDVLYGRAVLPPVRNARMATVSTAGVQQVKGFVALVEQSEFVGVVCKTPSAVDAAMAKIQVTWDLQQPINQQEIDRLVDVDAAMAEGDLEHVLVDEAHRPDANWGIDLRFDVQVQSHAAQEARVAIARFNDTDDGPKLEIWTGTQDPFAIKRFASMDTGMSEDDVVVYPQRLGGVLGQSIGRLRSSGPGLMNLWPAVVGQHLLTGCGLVWTKPVICRTGGMAM
jgi:CO/xanthine dehydrogenase Mo-binding subunit